MPHTVRKLPNALVAVLAAFPLLGVYGAAYWAALDHTATVTEMHIDYSGGTYHAPEFRFGGRAAEWFFWPALQVDIMVRPEHWHEQI
jgi:hypothetical protein